MLPVKCAEEGQSALRQQLLDSYHINYLLLYNVTCEMRIKVKGALRPQALGEFRVLDLPPQLPPPPLGLKRNQAAQSENCLFIRR